MKELIFLAFLLISNFSFSQISQEEKMVKELIDQFFIAFHAQDSVALQNLAHPEIKMQSVGIDARGNTSLATGAYSAFLSTIASIPKSTEFKEHLHDFQIHINGMIANVSIPYTFFVNGKLSHCGVNTFQLMKSKATWKIIYLVDTRSKSGCE